jgi:hypothetical protein
MAPLPPGTAVDCGGGAEVLDMVGTTLGAGAALGSAPTGSGAASTVATRRLTTTLTEAYANLPRPPRVVAQFGPHGVRGVNLEGWRVGEPA